MASGWITHKVLELLAQDGARDHYESLRMAGVRQALALERTDGFKQGFQSAVLALVGAGALEIRDNDGQRTKGGGHGR